jgi:hypothetical protein
MKRFERELAKAEKLATEHRGLIIGGSEALI